jgi:Fe-S-cluster containining protein
MTEGIAERLKAEWFIRFDQILENGRTIPSSNLKCLKLCEARCCPRVGMREMETSEIISPVVVLLPFEMEYLIKKTGISGDVFRRWPITMTPELSIEVGMLDLGKPCPFLSKNLQCSIHAHNPLDCRTFPLLPFQDLDGNLAWQLGENCPSLSLLSPKFVEAVKRVWCDLFPFTPKGWWELYAFADTWTGWPIPPSGVDGGKS